MLLNDYGDDDDDDNIVQIQSISVCEKKNQNDLRFDIKAKNPFYLTVQLYLINFSPEKDFDQKTNILWNCKIFSYSSYNVLQFSFLHVSIDKNHDQHFSLLLNY